MIYFLYLRAFIAMVDFLLLTVLKHKKNHHAQATDANHEKEERKVLNFDFLDILRLGWKNEIRPLVDCVTSDYGS